MRKTLRRRLTGCLLAAALMLSLVLPASAASFTIPTAPMSTEDGVIKVTAARAGQIAPIILGCNLVGSSNLGASMNDYNKISSILGVFGSDINASPDPYLYNHNYNLYAADKGLPTVENAAIAESQADGTPATTEAALNILTHRPDLLLNQGAGTGSSTANKVYAEIIPTLPENTDEDTSNDYAPSYYTCSISTLVYQGENLINLANVINNVCEEEGLTTRYGDPYVIATNYNKYIWGYYFYIQKQLAEGVIAKKDVVVVSKTGDNGANWTLPAMGTNVSQTKPNRLVEYVRDNTNLLNTTSESTASISAILDCDVVIANGNGTTLRSAAAEAGYAESDLPLIIDTLPTCLYGMVMQTHENALGIPYLQSIIYGEELGLNPVYAAAYFYNNFFHITDDAALQETVSTLLGSATLPEGVTTALNQYDPEAVEEILVEGIEYAVVNGLKRHDDTKAWNPDLSVGIGSEETTATMTRAMLATILYQMAGTPAVDGETTFTDLTQDWYKDAVIWAQTSELINGVGNNKFAPDEICSFEQIVTVIARYAAKIDGKEIPVSGDLSAFADADAVSAWAVDSVAWAVSEGMITGTQLNPNSNVTRAQADAMIELYQK